MHRILSVITSLRQHIEQISHDPTVYRPVACPRCGRGCLWLHGFYPRKADRRGAGDESLNPIPIPRFRCGNGCGRTCSRLPLCVAPRRWHDWAVQQCALMVLLLGGSRRQASGDAKVDRRTVSRWWSWLAARHETFSLFLRSRFPEWGRAVDSAQFWRNCLAQMPLAGAMAWLDRDLTVP
jgi:transposase-like protein